MENLLRCFGFIVTLVDVVAVAYSYYLTKKTEGFSTDEGLQALEEVLVAHFKPIIEKELGLTGFDYHLNAHQDLIMDGFIGHFVLGLTSPNLFNLNQKVVELYRQAIAHQVMVKNFGKFDLSKYAVLYVTILAHELRHVKQFVYEGYDFDDLEGNIFSRQTGVRKELEKGAKAYEKQFKDAHKDEILAIVSNFTK